MYLQVISLLTALMPDPKPEISRRLDFIPEYENVVGVFEIHIFNNLILNNFFNLSSRLC